MKDDDFRVRLEHVVNNIKNYAFKDSLKDIVENIQNCTEQEISDFIKAFQDIDRQNPDIASLIEQTCDFLYEIEGDVVTILWNFLRFGKDYADDHESDNCILENLDRGIPIILPAEEDFGLFSNQSMVGGLSVLETPGSWMSLVESQSNI